MKILRLVICGALLLSLSACFLSSDSLIYKASGGEDPVKGIKVADAIYKNGDILNASKMYERLLNKDLEDPSLWLKYGETLYELERYVNALEVYEAYIDLSPLSCKGFLGAGRSNLRLARPAAAGAYFQTCLTYEPKNKHALIGVAISNDMAGHTSLSHVYYQRALSISPYDPQLRNNYSLSLLLEGKYDDAIRQLSQIAFGTGSSVSIRQNLALAYGLKGDMAAASHVAALDFPSDVVRNNLQYFQLIRNLPGNEGVKAAILGGMKSK